MDVIRIYKYMLMIQKMQMNDNKVIYFVYSY